MRLWHERTQTDRLARLARKQLAVKGRKGYAFDLPKMETYMPGPQFRHAGIQKATRLLALFKHVSRVNGLYVVIVTEGHGVYYTNHISRIIRDTDPLRLEVTFMVGDVFEDCVIRQTEIRTDDDWCLAIDTNPISCSAEDEVDVPYNITM